MFRKTSYQLTLAYLTVLSAILGAFILAVRITFVRSLNWELDDKLKALAIVAVLELEIEEGELVADEEDTVVDDNRAVQWFDLEGKLVAEQGEFTLELPLEPKRGYQSQTKPFPAKGLTVPVNDEETDELIGYARVSASTADLRRNIRNLDLGLVSGTAVALVMGGIGSIWLTRRAMQPIESSFRKLQRFTSDASHELRSPLMAIKANAAVALKYPEGMRELDREKFQAIGSASTQLTSLTEKLLFLARSDRQIELQLVPCNLTEMLEQLGQLYQPLAQSKNVELQQKLDKDLVINGDEIQLKLLFTNLLDNALRYTPTGGTVTVQTTQTQNQLQISFRDTGIGIAPENLQQIFERFWQADKARSYQSGGFGLGLAIAQSAAQTHGGAIAVTSELGKGSCFTVSFPYTPVQPTATPKTVSSSSPQT